MGLALSKKKKKATNPPSPCSGDGSCLHALPELVHETIASYLTNEDLLHTMEVCKWLMDTYGRRVKDLCLKARAPATEPPPNPNHRATQVASLLGRRPALMRVLVQGHDPIMGLAEAIKAGHCTKVQVLEVQQNDRGGNAFAADRSTGITLLLEALKGQGACPRMDSLSFPVSWLHVDQNLNYSFTTVMGDLGETLRSRMEEGGCCELKTLEFFRHCSPSSLPHKDLSPVLSSGACESLEVLNLGFYRMEGNASCDMEDWLLRTKATRLRRLASFREITPGMAAALSAPEVAPRLQSIELGTANHAAVSHLAKAIRRGAWPDLTTLKMDPDQFDKPDLWELTEALRFGGHNLKVLQIGYRADSVGGMALAEGLRQGAMPQLEALDLPFAVIGDDGLAEVARALEGGAPCNTTLLRLNLRSNLVNSEGIRSFAEALARGACPNLQSLDLGENLLCDEGVMAFAQVLRAGALPHLLQLKLDTVLDEMVMRALFEALGHGACPQLESLHLFGRGIAEGVKADLVERLQDSRSQSKINIFWYK